LYKSEKPNPKNASDRLTFSFSEGYGIKPFNHRPMSDFSPEQIAQMLSIQRTFNAIGFDSAFRLIEDLTQSLPIVPREQYRLFSAFCLFKIQLSRTHIKSPRVPNHILRYHDRLLADIRDIPPEVVNARWNQFKAPKFVAALEAVAEGHPDLIPVIALVKSNPTGKGFLDLIDEHRGRNITDLNPRFLHFLPRNTTGLLISEREYDQIRLLPKK
jgi:hypothetical protein